MAKPIRHKLVQLTAIVDPPTPGLSTTFTLFKPTGDIVSKVGVTDQSGTSVVQFALARRKDKPGVYRGRVVVILGNNTLSAEASVVVQ